MNQPRHGIILIFHGLLPNFILIPTKIDSITNTLKLSKAYSPSGPPQCLESCTPEKVNLNKMDATDVNWEPILEMLPLQDQEDYDDRIK